MNDPNSVMGNYIHWVIINLVCNNNIISLGNNEIILVDYTKPSPPKNSGIHHYIFSIYEQDNKIVSTPKTIPNIINNEDLLDLLHTSKKIPIISNYFISYFTNGGLKINTKKKHKIIKRKNKITKRKHKIIKSKQ